MGRRAFATVLAERGVNFVVHDKIFGQDTPDEEWILSIAGRGLVAVTRDKRIGRNPTELHAVYASGIRMIAVVGGGVPAPILGENFSNAILSIESFVQKHPGPFIARLSRPSSDTILQTGGHGALAMYKSRNDLIAQFGR